MKRVAALRNTHNVTLAVAQLVFRSRVQTCLFTCALHALLIRSVATAPARKSHSKKTRLATSEASNDDQSHAAEPETERASRDTLLSGLVPVRKTVCQPDKAKRKRGKSACVAADDTELLDMAVFDDYVAWKLTHPERGVPAPAPAPVPDPKPEKQAQPAANDGCTPLRLNLKIKSRTVNQCTRRDGSLLRIDDVVWGKLSGWPWWPGRVLSIVEVECSQTASVEQTGTVQKTVAIEWFGDRTISEYPCDELRDFVDEYAKRFDRKALSRYSGRYRLAIREAQAHAYQIMQTEMHSDASSTAAPPASSACTSAPAEPLSGELLL